VSEGAAGLRCSVFWSDGSGSDCLRELDMPPGATLGDAVAASGIAALQADSSWRQSDGALRLAVWGRARQAGDALHDGDRVDVTRALHIDPKEARRLRARHRLGKAQGQARGQARGQERGQERGRSGRS
jgi:putative ubiquitin-RnfH superfamily antitoxin RatB of RatAB toxin-antitoxin module